MRLQEWLQTAWITAGNVQLLLPLSGNDGHAVPADEFAAVRRELTEPFGGVTAHVRAPASGAWKDGPDVEHDHVVTVEVVVRRSIINGGVNHRAGLETRFRQKSIHARVLAVTLL